MSKLFQFNEQALKSCLTGVKITARAVSVTLGPKGRNVIIFKGEGSPLSTKDGVTVAKEIFLKDKFENMGAQLVKEASSKTNDIAGDGSTTVVVLTEAILSLGVRNVIAGACPMDIKTGIDKAVALISLELDKMAKVVSTNEEILQVATISANNDLEIGQIIAKAMAMVGKDGTITIAESKGVDTNLDVVKGMQFDKGYASPYFVTDGEKMIVEQDLPFVLVTDKKITNAKEIVHILEAVHAKQRPLLIIAEDVDSDALTALVLNKIKVGLNVCAARAPAFGDRRKSILHDIAALCGAEFISDELGLKLEDVGIAQLGEFKKAILTKDTTTLIDGFGNKDAILARCDEIRYQIKKTNSEYEKTAFKERLAKLTGGVAIINVGAITETELKEKKARVEDALHATQAAALEGVVVGGGVALIRACDALKTLTVNADEILGFNIIKQACLAPAIAIANNCGKTGALVAEKIFENSGCFGYDGLSDVYGDLMAIGIIDPVLVTKTALKNAASIAGLLLTISCMITEKPKALPSQTPNYGGMGDFDGMDMM